MSGKCLKCLESVCNVWKVFVITGKCLNCLESVKKVLDSDSLISETDNGQQIVDNGWTTTGHIGQVSAGELGGELTSFLVNTLFHSSELPRNLWKIAQQAGRAGRDRDSQAACVTIYWSGQTSKVQPCCLDLVSRVISLTGTQTLVAKVREVFADRSQCLRAEQGFPAHQHSW